MTLLRLLLGLILWLFLLPYPVFSLASWEGGILP